MVRGVDVGSMGCDVGMWVEVRRGKTRLDLSPASFDCWSFDLLT